MFTLFKIERNSNCWRDKTVCRLGDLVEMRIYGHLTEFGRNFSSDKREFHHTRTLRRRYCNAFRFRKTTSFRNVAKNTYTYYFMDTAAGLWVNITQIYRVFKTETFSGPVGFPPHDWRREHCFGTFPGLHYKSLG